MATKSPGVPPDSRAPEAPARWVHHSTLIPWDKNPRINDHTVPAVAESIRGFGFISPPVVWTSKDRVVAGHTRLKAIQFLLDEDPDFICRGAPGAGIIPVRFHEFASEEEAIAYAIADNRLTERADWDYETLSDHLTTLQDSGFDLLLTGWEDHDVCNLLTAAWSPPEVDDLDGELDSKRPEVGYTVIFSPEEWSIMAPHLEARRAIGDEKTDGAAIAALIGAQAPS